MNKEFTDQPEALPENAATRHVFLGLQFGEIEGGREHQHISHVDEPVEERHGGLHHQPLRGLEHLQLALRDEGKSMCDRIIT